MRWVLTTEVEGLSPPRPLTLTTEASDADKVISSKAKARYWKAKAKAMDHKARAKDTDKNTLTSHFIKYTINTPYKM